MSRLSTVSKIIILCAGIPTLALTSFNCYNDVTAPDLGAPVFETAPPMAPSYTTVYVQAIITRVHDNKSCFGGAISVGDTVSGFLAYDDTKQDSNPDSTIGDYSFDMPPQGIKLLVSGFCFRSDAQSVKAAMRLENDNALQTPAYDLCSFQSIKNMNVLPDVSVSRIEISLRDDEARALSSDKLLGGICPFLHRWPTTHSLSIKGKQFQIIANIVSFSDGAREVLQEMQPVRKKFIHMD